MTSIFYAYPELVIGLNRKVICVNPNDLQIFKEIELPEDLTKCGFDLKNNNDTTANDELEQQTKNGAEATTPSIQQIQISPNRQLMAITTSGQKAVLLYQLRPEHAKLISIRTLSRNSSALAFHRDSKCLLVTDKAGDCYVYDCVDLNASPKLLLGHLSIVYDVLWSNNDKFIITCVRDDKIRVTNYPNTYDIHGYCLGHTEFVSSIKPIESDFIISISGDRTMRLWDYTSCEELSSIELPAPGIRLDIKRIDEKLYQAAVVLHQPNESIALYEISHESGQWTIKHLQQFSFPDFNAQRICFAAQRLYCTGLENGHFTVKVVPIEETPALPENWLAMVDEQFSKEAWTPEDLSTWYKKKFDNVSAYMERKKRRIEEHRKKNPDDSTKS